ncbi:MAG: MinD/ParA family protein [Planctomycetaceae bacterium]
MANRFQQTALADPNVESRSTSCARTIAVTSGKGGVGKSNIALNLAIGLARLDTKVCLIDANLGLGNVDLLCGLNGYWNLSHVMTGARSLTEIILSGPEGVHVVCGASGLVDIADCPAPARDDLFRQLAELEQTHDYLIVDTGTGIHKLVRQFVTAADLALIVTTPEPTAIADAYATVKALSSNPAVDLNVVVNRAESARQAQAIIERLQQTAQLFLKKEITSAGQIPDDYHVVGAVASRTPVLIGQPECAASQALMRLARGLKHRADHRPVRGSFFHSFPASSPPTS